MRTQLFCALAFLAALFPSASTRAGIVMDSCNLGATIPDEWGGDVSSTSDTHYASIGGQSYIDGPYGPDYDYFFYGYSQWSLSESAIYLETGAAALSGEPFLTVNTEAVVTITFHVTEASNFTFNPHGGLWTRGAWGDGFAMQDLQVRLSGPGGTMTDLVASGGGTSPSEYGDTDSASIVTVSLAANTPYTLYVSTSAYAENDSALAESFAKLAFVVTP